MRNPALRNLILCALFAALMGVVAQWRLVIPAVPSVPFTLQVMVVALAAGLLGPIWGAISMALYLLLGAAGLPVFAGGSAGAGVLVGPTAGYLWSYPLAAYVIGAIAPAEEAPGPWRTATAMLSGLVLIYLGGGGWALLVGGKNLSAVLTGWVLPFIPFDLLKLFMAGALSVSVNRALVAQGYWGHTAVFRRGR